MSQVNTELNKRLKKVEPSKKTSQLAQQSANGELSSFSGIFRITALSAQEKKVIEDILLEYNQKKGVISSDLNELVNISSEVKSINNQAALLHGERIKQAQQILKNYQEGAFTAWLIATYGNRQTPYNFLQYYDFCCSLPNPLREKVEHMPRQAVYTLASREGSIKEKEGIIQSYSGETKDVLLQIIREQFPLSSNDLRKVNLGDKVIKELEKLCARLARSKTSLSPSQKKAMQQLLQNFNNLI